MNKGQIKTKVQMNEKIKILNKQNKSKQVKDINKKKQGPKYKGTIKRMTKTTW